jgi:hypothetical protein
MIREADIAKHIGKEDDCVIVNLYEFASVQSSEDALLQIAEKASIQGTKKEILERKRALIKWVIHGTDSIPLDAATASAGKYKPLIISTKITAGLVYADTIPSGYAYLIPASHQAETGGVFAVDPMIFRKINLPVTKVLTLAEEKSGTLLVLFYQESRVNEKFPAVLVRINRGEAASLNMAYAFDQLPDELRFSPDTQVISVKTKNGQGEVFAINFDKTGKVVK